MSLILNVGKILMYSIEFTNGAKKDLAKLKKSEYFNKANGILEELKINPYDETKGLEKVYDGEVFYVRRISSKHRLVFGINKKDKKILVYELWNHYTRMGQKNRKK